MAVDQARHQRAAGTIDDGGHRRLDRPGRHLPDAVALHQQLIAAAQLIVLGVEHLEVLEEELRHAEPSPKWGRIVSREIAVERSGGARGRVANQRRRTATASTWWEYRNWSMGVTRAML